MQKIIDIEKLTDFITEHDTDFLYALEHQNREMLEELVKNIPSKNLNEIISNIRCNSSQGFLDYNRDYVPPMIETAKAIEIIKDFIKNENKVSFVENFDVRR